MNLNEQQQQAVRTWLAEGAGLSEVQKRLNSEFDLPLTYMETRLLVLELGAEVQDKPEPEEPKSETPEEMSEDAGEPLPDAAGSPGSVRVSLDRVVQAGALASGDVTFSDGVTAKWMLDQMGRLGLSSTSQPGYRPSPEDVQAFQVELQNLVQTQGL